MKHFISLFLSVVLTCSAFGQAYVQTDSTGTTMVRPSAGKLRTAIIAPTTLSSTTIDVTKTRFNRAISVSEQYSFSATPTKDTVIDVTYTADGSPRTVTWAVTVYSYYQAGDISSTGMVIPAGASIPVTFIYSISRSRWEILGDPPLTNGIGPYLRSAGTAVIASGKTMTVTENTTLNRQSSIGLPVEFCVACSDLTTAITTGTTKAYFDAPYAFTVTEIIATVLTAPTGSTILIDVNEAGTTIISTKVMINASAFTSTSAVTPYVISDAVIANGARVTIDFDQVGSTIAGAGLEVWIKGYRN